MKKAMKLLVMLVLIIISTALFAGCTPSGFIKSKGDRTPPLIYNGDISNAIRDLRNQFADEKIIKEKNNMKKVNF